MTQDPAAIAGKLSDHLPSGLRSKRYEIASTHEAIEGPIQCDCDCGLSFSGTDIQEVKFLWAEHVAAILEEQDRGE